MPLLAHDHDHSINDCPDNRGGGGRNPRSPDRKKRDSAAQAVGQKQQGGTSETTLSLTSSDIERMIQHAVDRTADRIGGGGTQQSVKAPVYEETVMLGGDTGVVSPTALQQVTDVNEQLNAKLKAMAARLVQVEEASVQLRDALQHE